MRRRRSGYSLFELAVALSLLSILIAVFLDRAAVYQEMAEKAAMEQVALDLRSSVNLKVAELVLENRFADLVRLSGQNPMDLLTARPANYLGVLPDAAAPGSVKGKWYFDKELKETVYCPDLGRNFNVDSGGARCVAWKIVLVGKGALKSETPQWARFELVRPYHWF